MCPQGKQDEYNQEINASDFGVEKLQDLCPSFLLPLSIPTPACLLSEMRLRLCGKQDTGMGQPAVCEPLGDGRPALNLAFHAH